MAETWVKVGPHKEVLLDGAGRLRSGLHLTDYLREAEADKAAKTSRMSSAAGAESEYHMEQQAGIRWCP